MTHAKDATSVTPQTDRATTAINIVVDGGSSAPDALAALLGTHDRNPESVTP